MAGGSVLVYMRENKGSQEVYVGGGEGKEEQKEGLQTMKY